MDHFNHCVQKHLQADIHHEDNTMMMHSDAKPNKAVAGVIISFAGEWQGGRDGDCAAPYCAQ